MMKIKPGKTIQGSFSLLFAAIFYSFYGVFSRIVGWLLYLETLTFHTFLGGLLIILGASLPAINKLKRYKD